MRGKKIKILLYAVAAIVLLPVVFWYAAVPDSAIPGLIASRAGGPGYDVRVNNFHKGLLLSFSAASVTVGCGGRPALAFEGVRGRINPLGLLGLRLLVPFKAVLAGGTVRGRYAYGLFSGRSRVRAKVEGAQLSGLPLIKGSRGTLRARLEYAGGPGGMAGSLMFSAKDLRDFPYGFRNANGVVYLTPGGLKIKSISLDSGEMYAKLKGGIHNGQYNIRMEVTTPGPGETCRNPLLAPYRVSPGYYVIPLSGRFRQLP